MKYGSNEVKRGKRNRRKKPTPRPARVNADAERAEARGDLCGVRQPGCRFLGLRNGRIAKSGSRAPALHKTVTSRKEIGD